MNTYTNYCVCGESYGNDCAHFLSNWLIKKGNLSKNPSGAFCCNEGRPIRAKEMRNVFINSLGLSRYYNPPEDGSNCFIYCERNSDHQGHVYYGRKGNCVAGTGDGSFGADYYEYYY